jgi:hypothetical protein
MGGGGLEWAEPVELPGRGRTHLLGVALGSEAFPFVHIQLDLITQQWAYQGPLPLIRGICNP